MSATVVARAVIGCEVTGKLYENVETPGCAHSPLQVSGRFCIECGEPRLVTVKRPRSYYNEGRQAIAGLQVATTGDYPSESARAFAGVLAEVRGWDNYEQHAQRADDVDLSTARDAVRMILAPLGLWDEASFGLWSVLYYS